MRENSHAYDRLVKLGAPQLPDNRFYRIRLDESGRLDLQVRQYRKRFGSDLLASARLSTADLLPERIAAQVATVLGRLVARTQAASSVHELLGDAKEAGK